MAETYISQIKFKHTGNPKKILRGYLTNVYLRGSASATSSKSAYLRGGIETSAIPGTFTDGFGGDVNTAYDDSLRSGYPNNNYGARNEIYCERGLLRFDLSSISPNATCVSANLYLYAGYRGGGYTYPIYSVASGNMNWSQGTKAGSLADIGEPCWNYRAYNTTPWAGSAGLSTSGIDYESSVLGTFFMSWQQPVYTEYNISLTPSRIEGWFGENNTNYGLLIKYDGTDDTVQSSEYQYTEYRPKLVVHYTKAADGSSKSAYLFGQAGAVDNQAAYLRGQSSNNYQKSAYLVGSSPVVDNQSAFINGYSSSSSNKTAYTYGEVDYQFEIEWAAVGLPPTQVLEETSQKSAYLVGESVASDSKPSFTKGGLLSSKHSYLIGGVFPFSDDFTGTNGDPFNPDKWNVVESYSYAEDLVVCIQDNTGTMNSSNLVGLSCFPFVLTNSTQDVFFKFKAITPPLWASKVIRIQKHLSDYEYCEYLVSWANYGTKSSGVGASETLPPNYGVNDNTDWWQGNDTDYFCIRVQILPLQIRGHVWKDGDTEPDNWIYLNVGSNKYPGGIKFEFQESSD